MSKPSIPEGTRDFSPEVVAKRNYIFDTVRKVFVKYGFQPIETPTMEKLSTLTGKYGDEGDKLLFKVLNNGDFLAKANKEALANMNSPKLVSSIAERGLRYDLTVPFARYVVMHQNEIVFPFKRYQIQPVWRADRPQRGRYREFYQCDVDVVGSTSLVYEAELVQIYDEVFSNLGLDVVIKINNRKILFGMAEAAGIPDKFMDMTIAIDKLDKIGWDGVAKELTDRGIGDEAIALIDKLLKINNLEDLEKFGDKSDFLLRGVKELRTFHEYFDLKGSKNEVQFDITLARGLNYYTGCIFEVAAKGVKMGSIGGGGRYDDLTGVFGLKGVSGVGVSFGADRIYDCLAELDLFPKENQQSLKVILFALDEESHLFAFNKINEIRKAGINADIYPVPIKMRKIWEYAEKRKVPFVVTIGSEERESGLLCVKNMVIREISRLSLEKTIELLMDTNVIKPKFKQIVNSQTTDFKEALESYFTEFFALVSTTSGDWTVKGFIDLYKNIYTISIDTKVISKIIELMIFPIIVKFAEENNYDFVLSAHQNHYPDLTFIHKETKEKIAVDLKSTYRTSEDKVNGMTLGAFTGYFRNRQSNKNITFPYSEYSKHYILGVVYSPVDNIINEREKYTIDDLPKIASVVKDFDFFLQEKWKIAIDRPGSGNTKNIGSTQSIKELKTGTALFTKHPNGQRIFDDYWMNYLTKDMAKSIDLDNPHYNNLKSYFNYKDIKNE